MNRSDSERIAFLLTKHNFKQTKKIKNADLIVVNMCSVRQSAVDRVYGLIPKLKKLKKENKGLKTVLTGCILKKDKKKLSQGFDYILEIKKLNQWPKVLFKLSPLEKKDYFSIPQLRESKFLIFIPISSGCENFCTYCVVPYTRGPLICRPPKKILEDVKRALCEGVKEIWLLGQNVNSYRFQKTDFASLLSRVARLKGNFWIRFTSSHPKDFSDRLIEVFAKTKKITPYVNLPVQSGDNEILKRMNRPYNISQYKKIIKKIRQAFKKYRQGLEKEIAISTDIIVGFPGEKRKHFKNTEKLVKEIGFNMAYIAEYSPRPGTAAYYLKDGVSPKEKERRRKALTKILEKVALEKNQRFINKTISVLVEEKKNGYLLGKSRHFKTVKFKGKKSLIGQFVKVKIVDCFPWGLKGNL